MKLYRFYKVPTKEALENSADLRTEDKYPLYAFTVDKDLYKIFKSTRNLKEKFIEMKSKVTKEEYVNFANKNSNCQLGTFSFSHCTKGYPVNGRHVKMEDIGIVCTWEEREWISSACSEGVCEISNAVMFDCFPFMLKDKYINALKTLEYLNLWKLYGEPEKYSGFYTEKENEDYMGYGIEDNIIFDELNLFIKLFGDTFRK